jgi:voltage-gated potassium channel Kch
MTNRIAFAYGGAIGLPLLLLSVAIIYTMGGHSLMYLSVYSSPIGLLAGLSYSDVRRQYETKAILIRSAASVIVFIVSFALILFISEAEISPFVKNQGWILIVLVVPLITATATSKILASRIQKKPRLAGGRS